MPTRLWASWALAALFPFAFVAALLAFDQPFPADSPFWARSAWVTTEDGSREAIQLRWLDRAARPDADGIARTEARIEFSVEESMQPWAVVVPRARTAFSLTVNDQLVGGAGQLSVPVSWVRWPVLITVPPAMLHQGSNRLLVSTATEARVAAIPPLLIGPQDQLRPDFERARFFSVTVVRAIIVAMLVLAVLILGLFLLRRRDTVYGWFGLTLALWAIHTAHDQIEWIPIANRHVWFTLSYLSLGWFVIVAAIFVHRLIAVKPIWIERCLWLIGIGATLGLLWQANRCGNCFYPPAQKLWVPLINVIGLYTLGRLIWHVRTATTEVRLLIPAAWLLTVVGIRDYLWEISVLPAGSTYYLAYASAFVLAVFSAIMLRRFAAALTESETLNRELTKRVASKSVELEANFRTLAAAERKRVRLEERQLVMRDMHDNLGGDLVQALAIIDAQPDPPTASREAVQRCLNDLRLLLDTSEVEGGDVMSLIASFRHRVERGLRRAGIEMRLSLDELPVCVALDAQDSLHLLRILQESVNNILKHAGANQVELAVRYLQDPPTLQITVRDNGRGLPAALDGSGRGLDNMQWRAAAIGAAFHHHHQRPGTTVELMLPLIGEPRGSEAPGDITQTNH